MNNIDASLIIRVVGCCGALIGAIFFKSIEAIIFGFVICGTLMIILILMYEKTYPLSEETKP